MTAAYMQKSGKKQTHAFLLFVELDQLMTMNTSANYKYKQFKIGTT